MPGRGGRRPAFRKVLYDAQQRGHYADNYVDTSFLTSLSRNPNVRLRSYDQLLARILPVTQHLTSLATFVALFCHLYSGRLSAEAILWTTSIGTLAGYVWWEKQQADRRAYRPRAAVLAFILPLMLVLLSPVLKALTRATTSDTIWTLAGILLAFNALFADYSVDKSSQRPAEGFPAALSLNAAMCAATVLASRLDAHAAVSSLLLFAGAWFALLPTVRRPALAPLELLVCAVAWTPLGLGLFATVACLLLAVTFGAPAALLHASKHKDELRGPWDVAHPRVEPH